MGKKYKFKIVVIGDSAVGKSNLLSRFARNEFEAKSKATIEIELRTKHVEIDGKKVTAQIWDTAGQKGCSPLTYYYYYRNAVGALIVYDISKRSTFDSIKRWLEELHTQNDSTIARMLVGNKCDLENLRDVSTEEGKSLAEREGLFFMETSALDSTNVQTAFEIVIRDIYSNISRKVLNSDSYKAELSVKQVSLVNKAGSNKSLLNSRNEAGSVADRSFTPSVVASQAQGPNFLEKLKPYVTVGIQEKWDKFSLDELISKFTALRDNFKNYFKNKFHTEQATFKKRAEDAEFIAHRFQVQLKEAQASKATAEETAKSVADKLKFVEHSYSELMKERIRVAELEMEVDTLKSKVSHIEKAAIDMDSKFEAHGLQIRGWFLDLLMNCSSKLEKN